MSDLTAEQRIAEALAAEAKAEAECECLCHAEDWCGACGHSFEGRVLPPLPVGERRIVLTTTNGKWPGTKAAEAMYEWMEGPNAPVWLATDVEWFGQAVRVVLDALAGEGT